MKIYAISDQHGYLPDIPACDLLLVAGDNCPDYPGGAKERLGSGPQMDLQFDWFCREWIPWRQRQPATMCLFTHGNHDYWGERAHAIYGSRFALEDWGPDTVGVVDGPFEYAGLRIWLTPWSSQFRDWAFMADEDRLTQRYAHIPSGVDILVSHQPPAGCGGRFYDLATGKVEEIGSRALLEAIDRSTPHVVVCGHVHSGHGTYQHQGTRIYNVAIVDEAYQLVHQPTEIRL